MTTYSINVPVSGAFPPGMRMDLSGFPNLGYAVQRVSEAAQAQWVSYAKGEPLPSGQVIRGRSGAYAASIQLRQVGDFAAQVYSNLPLAKAVEEGSPERDLKVMLNRSLKVRRVENKSSPNYGKRYLIIPFRWNTQGSGGMMANVMSNPVQGWWKGKRYSHVTGWTERKSGTGAWDPATRAPLMVPQRKYDWGSRLGAADLARLGVKGEAAKRAAGMVRFNDPQGRKGGKHGQYMTFRVMMEGSSGWIVPPQPGKYPARAVEQQFRRVAEVAFQKAVEADIAALFGRGLGS